MPQGLNEQPDGDCRGQTAWDLHALGLTGVQAPRVCERGDYLDRRRGLVAELTRCHDETVAAGALIQALPAMSQLGQNFSFRDALELRLNAPLPEGEELATHTLKSRMAAAVQEQARRADAICETPQQREDFFRRLEGQFLKAQSTLILQERERCAEKLRSLCDRLDTVLEQLGILSNRAPHHEACLRGMSQALRTYTEMNLGEATISLGGNEVIGWRGTAAGSRMSIPEFLSVLDNLVVETLNRCLDQAAA